MTEETRTLQLDVKGLGVFIGMPCGPSVPWQTVQSILETSLQLKGMGIGFEVRFVAGCSIVQMARNKVFAEFLRSPANRLFMIDSDMQWEPAEFMRLLALSTKMEVVCGAYRMKQDDQLYALKWNAAPMKYNDWGCVPIEGTGLGFTVVRREVIEAVAAKSEMVRWHADPLPIPYICHIEPVNGELEGEDIDFFLKCREAGYTVHLDPNVTLGHIGSKVYRGTIRDAMRPA